MVFWPWNTWHKPENTDTRQYNSIHIKCHQPKTTYQKGTVENEFATVPSNPTETQSQEQ